MDDLALEARPESSDCLDPQALYVHVPFCFHKCHYCDFYSIVDRKDRQAAFTGRMVDELDASLRFFRRPVESIFVGGGTPTLLAVDHWRTLLAAIGDVPREASYEFTVEANPETVTSELLDVLVAGGVNRLSIGAQTFDRRGLEMLERHHDPASVVRSVSLARAAGIVNLSLDLIFGVPGHNLDGWRLDLDTALDLEPTHLSCYALTYEPGTALTQRLAAGRVERIDEDVEAAMFELTIETLAARGYEHYEVSNWARPGRRCRHNLVYWTNAQWWPVGPSASGHAGGWRWKNVPRLTNYLESGLESGPLPPIVDAERLDRDGRIGEELMLGFRLLEGLARARLDELLESKRGEARRACIERHTAAGLLEESAGRVRFSRRGLMLADSVLAELI